MSLSDAANIATAIGIIGVFFGLLMTVYQIREARKTSRGQFLHDIECDAQRFHSLFKHLLPVDKELTDDLRNEIKADELLIFSALAFFEKVQLLIDNGSIDLKSVDITFGGRFFIIVHSKIVQSTVLLNPVYVNHFSTLARLYQALYAYRISQNAPIILNYKLFSQ